MRRQSGCINVGIEILFINESGVSSRDNRRGALGVKIIIVFVFSYFLTILDGAAKPFERIKAQACCICLFVIITVCISLKKVCPVFFFLYFNISLLPFRFKIWGDTRYPFICNPDTLTKGCIISPGRNVMYLRPVKP